MAYGVLIESMIQAKNIDALNRSVKAEINVAGGGLVALTAPTTQGDDVWTAAAPSSELGGLWMAYNPEVKYILVNGKKFAGLSADARDYTNIAGEVFDAFKPKVGDEIVVTIDAVDDTGASAVAGDILESKASQTTLTRVAAATGATAGSTAFEIEWVGTIDFPKANVGIEKVKAFKAVCVQE
jgi:hypothetical protein